MPGMCHHAGLMTRIILIIAALLVVCIGGGAIWLSFADISPPVETVQAALPHDRLQN